MRRTEELREGNDRKRLSDLRQMLAKLDSESAAFYDALKNKQKKYANSQLFTVSCETG